MTLIKGGIEKNIATYNEHIKDYPALQRAAQPLSKPIAPILGREQELNDLRLALRNPEKANVILLGEPGSGKSAIVRGFTYDSNSAAYLTLTVDVERLADDKSGDKDAMMANGLLDLVKETSEFSKRYDIIVNLFMDEFHRIAMISPTAVESLKPILEKSAQNGFRVIAATTFEEYDQWIAPNRALDQRLLRMDLPELKRDAVINILKSRAREHHALDLADKTIFGEIYDVSNQILISNSQPRSSIDILLNMIGNVTKTEYMKDGKLIREYSTPDELNINSDYALSRPMLNRVIQRAYGIDIDNHINVQEVRKALETRIYNQDQAVRLILSRLEMSLAGFNDPTRPKISFLSTGPTGTGKALPDNELIPVPTKQGFVRNGDLKVGDMVFNRLGQPVEVTGVYHKGEKQIYRMTLSDGRVIDSADDHLWTYKSRSGSGSKKWKTTTTKELMMKKISVPRSGGRIEHQFVIPQNMAVQRPTRQYDIDPYTYGQALSHNQMASIDDNYKFGSIEQRWALIHGLFDEAGLIQGSNRFNVTYPTVKKTVAYDIQEILWSLGIMSSVVLSQDNYVVHVKVQNKDKQLFFTQPDKLAKAKEAQTVKKVREKKCDAVAIVSIEKLNETVPMTCIMIDDPEHLYLAGKGHVVTHNTELAKVISEALSIPLKRFDMSRYPRPEDAIEFANQLAKAAWSAPNAYILIDEAEKSTRECMNILLQVLDDARLTSENNANRVISFSGNIINLTTNLGSSVYQHQARFGEKDEHGRLKDIDTEVVYQSLADAKEFETAVLGRIDVIVPFLGLPPTALVTIAKNELDFNLSIAETAKRKILISPDILPYIVIDRTSSDSERGGARDAKRNIKNIVIQHLASYMSLNKPECPIIIRLDATPRFRDKHIADTKAADITIDECYSKDQIAKYLSLLETKLNTKLYDDGLFVPANTEPQIFMSQILALVKKGIRRFKTTVDMTRVVIIDSHQSMDIAEVNKLVTMQDALDQAALAREIAKDNRQS